MVSVRRVGLVGVCVAAAALLLSVVPANAATPTPPPPPPGKSSSPPTDLKDYPKLPVSKIRPPTSPGASRGVIAVKRLANGKTTATVYDPAPGVTNEQLYQKLKAKGVQGLQDPAGGGITPDNAYTCNWGTATTLGCPQLHWANNGYGHPQVYFVDHTGANWPVDVSTYTWNQAQGIDSTYVNGSCPGYGGTHCIDLFDADYGATGWVGLTTYNYDGNQNLIDGQVYIQLNDYNGYSLNLDLSRA